jgi:hypothetical protein
VFNNNGRDRLFGVSERDMLRKILGPAKDGEVWQIQYKRELYELFNPYPANVENMVSS